jgi:hypothetical protein
VLLCIGHPDCYQGVQDSKAHTDTHIAQGLELGVTCTPTINQSISVAYTGKAELVLW